MVGGDEEAVEEPQVDLLDQQEDNTLLTTFQIKPSLDEKFKPQQAREIIYSVLQENLGDKSYPEDENEKKELVKSLAIKIKQKCREMDYVKYKFVVNVVMGDQRGAGISSASRCFWDADADVCASNTFLNGNFFCMAAVFAVYFY
ncbi:dynein light chain Tctex-type protein 2B-like [Macrosteles quadrilineatus]|uniref:dynein light chain Tctex-type protein 2B-like n=1 Tax=Macrosteles quadrilineatus TaxID=74068 RepID=UPI0023E2AE5E|nr:dynein light chain Tctex-type protein 2B-like [Macrosteles quadrilineatus]XP_054258330.1 dynein light chain Tctex-type protein 2B-like [Macrosteles quadrilineatus]XP_054258331.1 dynein light chain Tctex-type protein 2B-like [Macrosteles quadrilineatus]XP_054258989.1 dynein light chain Tctex-type protein 2B-like [Macrosteles quadrilineatus]XP_054258990.1 dynein light chain Tctex-type protein 2B-like [Macrosteles quadrilineatus]